MEPEKKEKLDLSHFSKREELEKVAQICGKLNDLLGKSVQTSGKQEEQSTKDTLVEDLELKKKI